MAVYLPSAEKPAEEKPETPEVVVPVEVEEEETEAVDYTQYWQDLQKGAEGPEEDRQEEPYRLHRRYLEEDRFPERRELLANALLISGDAANSEVVTLRKKIKAILADVQELRNKGEVEVLMLSSGSGKMPLGGAALVWEQEGNKSFYTILIEGSQNQRKEWFTQAGESFDEAALAEVKRMIGDDPKEVGYCSLTSEEINDSDSSNILRTAVTCALNSLWCHVEEPQGLSPEAIGRTVLVNPKEVPDGNSFNELNRPVRTDYILEMRVQDRHLNHRLCHSKYWLDLAVDDGFLQPFVRISEIGGLASYSLETLLLAVAGTALCTDGEGWLAALQTRKYNKMNELAGLGYFIDEKRADTKGMAYGDEYQELLEKTCVSQAYIALDIPEASPLTWLTRHFVRESGVERGLEPAFESRDKIMEAANNLTGGHFEQVLRGHEFPFTFEGYRSISGYYVDKSGGQRSLDDVDTVTLVNSSKDVDSAIEWNLTTDRWVAPEEERLICREKLIKAVLPGAIMVGVNRVVIFNPMFIDALLDALRFQGISFLHDDLQQPSGRFDRFHRSPVRGLERRSSTKVNRLF